MQIVVDRKTLVLILSLVLLAFGTHGIGYSQTGLVEANSSAADLSASEILKKIQPSVVFIYVEKEDSSGSGSGVLVNKKSRLILTNAHVTGGNDEVKVFFPAYDSEGQLIQEKEFYIPNRNNSLPNNDRLLRRLGYITEARVVAEEPTTDIAIVIPKGIPKTAEQIKNDSKYDYSHLEKDTPVYIVGHPGNRSDLWQPDFGVFEEYQEKESFGLVIYANMYLGNSGGPVVDKDGWLIGLISRGDMQTKRMDVVPIKHILNLVKTIYNRNTFSIENGTKSTVVYEIKWSENGDWKEYSIKPDDKPFSHVNERNEWLPDFDLKAQGYPKTRYKAVQVPKDVPSTDLKDDKTISEDTALKTYELNTTSQLFSDDFKERFTRREGYNGYEYRFGYDSQQKQINLQEARQTVWIANHTEAFVYYEIKWTPDESTIREYHKLKPGTARPHWWKKSPEEEIPYLYPKLQFNSTSRLDKIEPLPLEAEILTHNINSVLLNESEFFNINTTEDENIINVKEQEGIIEEDINYYHFDPPLSPNSGASISFIGPIDRAQAEINRASEKRSIRWWIPRFVAALIIVALFVIVSEFIVPKVFPPKRPIFSIQNNTEATVDYQVKWTENEDWEQVDSLEPSEDSTEWYDGSSKEILSGYPKIRFDSIVDGKKETKEHTLETYTRRFGPKTEEKIGREEARQYHFELNSETQMLNLVDSEKSD